MISVEEALQRILSYVHVLEPEEKPILDALGQVLRDRRGPGRHDRLPSVCPSLIFSATVRATASAARPDSPGTG